MKIINQFTNILILLSIFISTACNKILEEKSDKSLGLPNSINSLQELLDYSTKMNKSSASWGEGASDNLYIPDDLLDQKDAVANKAYIWEQFDYDGAYSDWGLLYNTIYIANLVIEEINKITPDKIDSDNWNNILGSALFYRAQSYLQGVFIFCKGYDAITAKNEPGLPLRLDPDFNIKSTRSSLNQTYLQIIKDLEESTKLLSIHPKTNFRPSKEAAYGLLARTYLSMRNYEKAKLFADSCLKIQNSILDYNTLDLSQLIQFTYDNPELIFYRCVTAYAFTSASPRSVRVDSLLYNSYDENDLRKSAYFFENNPGHAFKGTYGANFSGIFSGIATDEIYFIRSECLARSGNIQASLDDLNKVLKNRWKQGTFVPFTANTQSDLLNLILKERRKELLFRCLRWMDLKRLNLEGRKILVKRKVHGKEYLLQPNSPKYAIPLPSDVVNLYHIPQNKY